MRHWIAIAIVLGLSGYAGVSFAFPSHSYWHMSASSNANGADSSSYNRAGGGGIYSTGGKLDFGIKCSHCHIDNKQQQGKISATIVPTPAWDTVSGADAYVPGQTYTVVVNLVGEHENGVNNTDTNGMAITFEGTDGKLAGLLTSDAGQTSGDSGCSTGSKADPYPHTRNTGTNVNPPGGKSTVIYGDCHGVLSLANQKLKKWTFTWKAPMTPPGNGDVTIFVGVVDGNTDGESSLDDDVWEAAITLKKK